MAIKKLPVYLRPREKFLEYGVEKLNDIELLAILINKGIKNFDAIDIAKSLIVKYNSLEEISKLVYSDLIKQKGIGTNTAIKIIATFNICNRINSFFKNNVVKIFDLESNAKNFISKINDFQKEFFMLSIFKKDDTFVTTKILNIGTIDEVNIDPTELIATVLKYGGRKFYCAHNHPSGIVKPSSADKLLTQRIKNYCELFKLKMLGHLIINSKGDYFNIK